MATGERVDDSDPELRAKPSAFETGEVLLHLSHDRRASLRAIRVNAELLAKGLKTGRTDNFQQNVNVIVADTAKIDLLAHGLASYSIACQIDPASFVVFSVEALLRK